MEAAPFVREIRLEAPLSEDTYPGNLPVVKILSRMGTLPFSAPVTFFVGENGVGKSTLIEAIAVALGFNPEGGTRNFKFSTAESHSSLHRALSVTRTAHRCKDGFFLRAESFYNVASYIDELDKIPAIARPVKDSYGGVSLHEQSHGESFLALMEHRFGGEGIYILDEPEAALSPTRILRLMVLLRSLETRGSQFIISTHSPILMAYPNACIYRIGETAIDRVAYTETEHYQLTKRFLCDTDRMLKYLFEEEM